MPKQGDFFSFDGQGLGAGGALGLFGVVFGARFCRAARAPALALIPRAAGRLQTETMVHCLPIARLGAARAHAGPGLAIG
ncbi:hypothetical protein EBQ26_06380 [Allofranklinella schreckenbergeri]|uniref:Uncharacterized protein n=1 Tax=Allofranklinella schreckenbergeri TaxID=1076744 RepID=A0A3M6Q8Y4_9BURK|nr:hypothetical protein EBQ26_06380 [Allofranklinella schreckenbergeri]